jgi:hypothetical protein
MPAVATVTVFLAGQDEGETSDEERYLVLQVGGWSLGVGALGQHSDTRKNVL